MPPAPPSTQSGQSPPLHLAPLRPALQVRTTTHSAHHSLAGLSSSAPSDPWLRRIVFNPSHIKGTLLRMLSGLAVSVPRHACGSLAATAVFHPPRAYWLHWLVRPTVQAASGSSWHRWGGKRPCIRTWGRHCQATGYTCHLIVSGSAKFSKGRL